MTARPPRRKKIATAVSLSAVLPVIHVRVGGGARHGGGHLGTGQPPTTVTTERSPSVSGTRTARRRPRNHRSTPRTPVSPCTDETSGGVCCMGQNGRGDEREDAWGRIRTLRASSHLHHEDSLLWLCSVSGRIVDRAGDWEWIRCCRLTLLFFLFFFLAAAAAHCVCCCGAECELVKWLWFISDKFSPPSACVRDGDTADEGKFKSVTPLAQYVPAVRRLDFTVSPGQGSRNASHDKHSWSFGGCDYHHAPSPRSTISYLLRTPNSVSDPRCQGHRLRNRLVCLC
jgi:hypothetical protein